MEFKGGVDGFRFSVFGFRDEKGILRRMGFSISIKMLALAVSIVLLIAVSVVYMGSTTSAPSGAFPIIGDESLMAGREHGTCSQPVQASLRWGVDWKTADNICCYNRHYAEHSSYWQDTQFLDELTHLPEGQTITFYDSVSGKPLFIAPKGRTVKEFRDETGSHGWPSFRDDEVVWDNVRCLANGEAVSLVGTHLGHNLPDDKGNRYCINLVSVAALPSSKEL